MGEYDLKKSEKIGQLYPVLARAHVFPYLGSAGSRHTLALKMVAMYGLKEKATSKELIEMFEKMSSKKQRFIAYNLSHELKIATLAASVAMNKQDGNVYEIGLASVFPHFIIPIS